MLNLRVAICLQWSIPDTTGVPADPAPARCRWDRRTSTSAKIEDEQEYYMSAIYYFDWLESKMSHDETWCVIFNMWALFWETTTEITLVSVVIS